MNKTEFEENDKVLAKYLKALSHPVRLSIIRALMNHCRCPHGSHPCNCGDTCEGKNCKCGCKCGTIVDMFEKSQSTVSQHIKELKNAGIIEIKSRKGEYLLNHSRLKEITDLLQNILESPINNFQEYKKCNCC